MSSAHDAVVLAAGGSRRLGQPKQLLMRDGETLVHRVVRLAAATAPRRLVVVTGANWEAVTDAVQDLPCDCVHNAGWDSGLAGSLRIAADALQWRDGRALLMGCDQPALEAAHLAALLSGARDATSGCAATLHADGAGIPAVVPHDWLHALPTAGDRGLGARLRALPDGAVFLLDAPALRFDIDTPQALAEAVQHGWIDARA